MPVVVLPAAEPGQAIAPCGTNNVVAVEVYYLPEGVLTFADVSPEELMRAAKYELIIRSEYAVRRLKEFNEILGKANANYTKANVDSRWGIVARDQTGRVNYSLFLAGNGTTGICQGKTFSCEDMLIRNWFKGITDCLSATAYESRGK